MIGNSDMLILGPIKTNGSSNPIGIERRHTEFGPISVGHVRNRIADSGNGFVSSGVVKGNVDHGVVKQDVWTAPGDAEAVAAHAAHTAALGVGQLHGVISTRQVIAMVINYRRTVVCRTH